MDKSQRVKDLMLLEIGDSIERAMGAMKSMSAYEDLKQARDRAEAEVELLQSTIKQLERDLTVKKADAPTMPVIPKAVAIAIFREGMAYGACRVCDELENATDIKINETGCTGGFEVNFTKNFDLSDELDLDYLCESTSVYDESSVIDALSTLCADETFEKLCKCRIQGINDQKTKDNDKEKTA